MKLQDYHKYVRHHSKPLKKEKLILEPLLIKSSPRQIVVRKKMENVNRSQVHEDNQFDKLDLAQQTVGSKEKI